MMSEAPPKQPAHPPWRWWVRAVPQAVFGLAWRCVAGCVCLRALCRAELACAERWCLCVFAVLLNPTPLPLC